MSISNQQILLSSRPEGPPVEDNFRLVATPLRPIKAREILIQNLYISLDAGFRNWMNEGSGDNILPAMPLQAPVMGLTLGKVLESRNTKFRAGDLLMGRFAWEKYSITTGADSNDFIVKLPENSSSPLSYHLGVLGDTGMSAYFGLMDIGKPQPGETLLVSGAGGAVGTVAGQIGKIFGARTVGTAGSNEKCRRLRHELGYDASVNYRTAGNLSAAIAAACPGGIDIYFDNIGGPLLEAALDNLAEGARIVMCGAISSYHSTTPEPGPANLFEIVTKQATMRGIMCHAQVERYDEARAQLAAWLDSGKLKSIEYRFEGIENTPTAFCDMFRGKNFGKTLVSLASSKLE